MGASAAADGISACGRINLGRGRTAPADNPRILVHKSVRTRMEAKDLADGPYTPRLTNWAAMEPIYVD